MAISGFFTYHDLYGGKPELYHRKIFSEWPSSALEEFISALEETDNSTTTTTTTTTTMMASTLFSTVAEIVQIDPFESNTTSEKMHELVQAVPFAYLQWFLVGLAVILTFLLSIIYFCFCRGHCRKNGKARQ